MLVMHAMCVLLNVNKLFYILYKEKHGEIDMYLW